jgi:predicted ATP-grasp superfamily ATP-dependent carboligase
MSRSVLVFSGFNQRAVIAFLRTLEKRQVSYSIIAASPDDTIFMTDYKDKVGAIRQRTDLNLADIKASILKLKGRTPSQEFLIAPSTEALNRFVLDHKSEFEKVGCQTPLVDKNLYETISDKLKFGDLCRQNGILVPEEFESVKAATIPFVAKPKTYFSHNNQTHSPVLIFNSDELMKFEQTYDIKDFYFQEYIGGESLYLLYYFYKNGEIEKFAETNLIQQPGGKSIVAAITSDFYKNEISGVFENLFKSLNFHGLVMIEIKQYNNKNYMIEANPRFWGPSQLFVDAGVNLFEAFLYDNQIISEKPGAYIIDTSVKYFWHGGLVQAQKSNKPATYYNYSQEQYNSSQADWLSADIYKREDTIKLYEAELSS